MTNFEKQSFGNSGVVVESGVTPIVGNFFAVQCVIDTVFAVWTENSVGGDAMTGITIPGGTILWGHITAFTLTSGTVRAHRRVLQ